MKDGRVIVFLKAPRPGFVKTRIAVRLDDEAATAIYQALVGMTLSRLTEVEHVELRYAPDEAGAEMAAWQRTGWIIRPQGEGDLGDRINRAVATAFDEGAGKVLILGSDCPEFAAEDLDVASSALDEHDVVLGPAKDGGYWLLGLARPRPELFRGIPWSTDQVFRTTENRALEAGLRIARLRQLRDVDTLEDWRAWLREHPL